MQLTSQGMPRGAGDPARDYGGCGSVRAGVAGTDGEAGLDRGTFSLNKGHEFAIHTADAADAADDFLTDVATLVIVYGGHIEAGFGGEQIRTEFRSPCRHGVENFEGGLVFRREKWELAQPK